MRVSKSLLIGAALLVLPSLALAEDTGGSRLFYVTATSTNPNTTVTLFNQTTGTGPGNLKGIACLFVGPPDTASPPGSLVNVFVTVDGGTQLTITLSAINFPADGSSTKQEFTGFLPYNVRFLSSLKVQLNRNNNLSGTYNSIVCQATYDLD
jgi:hypothetical protein